MRHLIATAVLAASFVVNAPTQAQKAPTAAPDQVIALDGPAWSKQYERTVMFRIVLTDSSPNPLISLGSTF